MPISLLTALTLLAGAQAPAPPPAIDARWQPWLGCWVAEDDRAGTGARTCVTPGPDGGVTIVTTLGVQPISRETRIADDRDHAVAVDDCRGSERNQWAPNGRRLYRTATVTCGAEAERTLTSTMFMQPGPTWVDVQALQQGTDTSVRVQRYRLAANQRLDDGRLARQAVSGAYDLTAAPWTVSDVVELSARLPADAVQAAIGEGTTAFDLNKRSLVALADADVAERVIDLMVGLTYPKRFVIQPGGGGGGGGFAGFGPMGGYDPFFAPILGAASLYGCMSPYGWATAGYFNNCGGMSPYLLGVGPGYWNGYYNSGWFLTNGVVNPPNGGGAAPAGDGRLVNGRGYTQVTPVEGTLSGSGGNWSGGSGTSAGTSSGNSSGGPSGVSSGGYSGGGMSGGGGGGGDRMAMPRPPGS